MLTMENQNRSKDVLSVIRHDVKRYVLEKYVLVTAKRCTTQEATGQAAWHMSQFVWFLGEKIVSGNPSVAECLEKILSLTGHRTFF